MAKTDRELQELFRSGREAAFSVICERYYKDVYYQSVALLKNKLDAEEVTNDAIVALSEQIKRENIRQIRAWVLTVAKRKCYDQLRARKAPPLGELLEERLLQTGNAKVVRDSILGRCKSLFIREAEQYGGDLEYILLSRMFHQESYKQIAEHLSLDPEKTRQSFSSAFKTIRRRIRKEMLFDDLYI